MTDKRVGMFMVGRVATWWCLSFISGPSGPAEAVPVLAAFAGAVAREAEIVSTVVTSGTVVVQVVLNVFFATSVA
jgi:hypothetical protein